MKRKKSMDWDNWEDQLTGSCHYDPKWNQRKMEQKKMWVNGFIFEWKWSKTRGACIAHLGIITTSVNKTW